MSGTDPALSDGSVGSAPSLGLSPGTPGVPDMNRPIDKNKTKTTQDVRELSMFFYLFNTLAMSLIIGVIAFTLFTACAYHVFIFYILPFFRWKRKIRRRLDLWLLFWTF